MRHSLCSVQLFTEPPTAQGLKVLYLVSLLLGTVVICITQRSHSVGSLGTTHDYGIYIQAPQSRRTKRSGAALSHTPCFSWERRPLARDCCGEHGPSHCRCSDIQSVKTNKRVRDAQLVAAQMSSTDTPLNRAHDAAMPLVECTHTPAGRDNSLLLYAIEIASTIQ